MDGERNGLPTNFAGRFRLERKLGQGSLARVFSAQDERRGVRVALKILHDNLRADASIVDRFRREVEIVRRIDHPHVIRTHGLVEDGGHLGLVMDLHEGGDLADLIARRGPLPEAHLARLVAQICGALGAAHRAGVVHRDLKPQNILVGPGAAGAADALDVRLADFGLARTADLAGLTTRATVLGTPEYMAPEVIAEGHADPRSDLYSLGVLLFEAATGRLPFRADSPYEMLRQHLSAPAPRARSLRADVPEALDVAIARALEKEPLDRHPSASAFAEACRSDVSKPSLAPLAEAAATARCQRCGAALVGLVRLCVNCGAPRLVLGHERGGPGVLVTGPGELTEKIDGASHVALVKLLEELPSNSVSLAALRRRPPRLPFLVATELDQESARRLRERLAALGFEASVIETSWLGPREIRKKIWRQSGREALVLTGGVQFMQQLARPLVEVPYALFLFPVAVLAPFVRAAVLYPRPVARRLPTTKRSHEAVARLAATLERLKRASDRKVTARLLERLDRIGTLLEPADWAPAAMRAARAAEALAAADDREAAEGVMLDAGTAGPGAGDALDRLREGERLRAALRADLLLTLGRLEESCARLERAQSWKAAADLAEARRRLSDLTADVAAEEEIAQLLGGSS